MAKGMFSGRIFNSLSFAGGPCCRSGRAFAHLLYAHAGTAARRADVGIGGHDAFGSFLHDRDMGGASGDIRVRHAFKGIRGRPRRWPPEAAAERGAGTFSWGPHKMIEDSLTYVEDAAGRSARLKTCSPSCRGRFHAGMNAHGWEKSGVTTEQVSGGRQFAGVRRAQTTRTERPAMDRKSGL